MKPELRFLPVLLPVAAAFLASPAQASCGAAFCSIQSDWTSETLGLAEGSSFDVRYERIRQDQPRTGSRRIGVGEIRGHHDEVRTTNDNLLLSYSHNFASGWGVGIVLPLVDREHLHIHNHRGAQLPEAWSLREPGDARITGRWQAQFGDAQSGARTAGVLFGLKLPTGRTGIANGNGDVAERSLQPGTGTTDAILGAFLHQQLPAWSSSWFAQAQLQHALHRHDDYAPGTQLSADLGIARRTGEKLSLLLQLNAVLRQRDRGTQAEPANSGSRSLFVSPGLGYDISDAVRVYGFWQVPLHQSVNGVQLTARRALTVGVTTRF